jgi:hypothetical protein
MGRAKFHDGAPFTGQSLISKEIQPHPGSQRLNWKELSLLPYYAESV